MRGDRTMRDLLTWRGGGTDLWPLLRDPAALDAVTASLAEPFAGPRTELSSARIDLVVGPDPGGLLLGPLVAQRLGVPFAPVCRDRRFFFQGSHRTVEADGLVMHHEALSAGTRALLVDDWSETGGTVRGVHTMVTGAGARLVAIAFLVDSLPEQVRESLRDTGVRVHALATVREWGSGA